MVKQEQRDAWAEITEIWGNSSKGDKINFQISELIDELKGKMSQFEKDSIKSDISKVKSSFSRYKGKVSQFEKDSISKDLSIFTKLIKIIVSKLRRKR